MSKNEFTKSELQIGMQVKLRNGDMYRAYKGFAEFEGYIDSKGSHIKLSSYSEDLICTPSFPSVDIVEIYKNKELIYKRDNKTQ